MHIQVTSASILTIVFIFFNTNAMIGRSLIAPLLGNIYYPFTWQNLIHQVTCSRERRSIPEAGAVVFVPGTVDVEGFRLANATWDRHFIAEK
jgi:hypothetical protein